MPRRPAREQEDPIELLDPFGREQRRVEVELARLERHLAAERLGDRGRLLVDLLGHEVAVAALFRGHGVPENPVDRALEQRALRVDHAHARRVHAGDVAVLEEDDVARPGHERDGVRGDEVLALPETEHDRRSRTRGDEHARLAARRHEHGVGAGELADGRAHRGEEVSRERGFDLVGEHLGVGLAREAVAGGGERRLALREVLEDAVVDDDDLAAAVRLRVRVGLGRPPVRRPARVPDSGAARRGAAGELLDEVAELSGRPVDREVAVGERGDPGRVVAAVLEPLQPVEQERAGLTGSDVSNDAAHK